MKPLTNSDDDEGNNNDDHDLLRQQHKSSPKKRECVYLAYGAVWCCGCTHQVAKKQQQADNKQVACFACFIRVCTFYCDMNVKMMSKPQKRSNKLTKSRKTNKHCSSQQRSVIARNERTQSSQEKEKLSVFSLHISFAGWAGWSNKNE